VLLEALELLEEAFWSAVAVEGVAFWSEDDPVVLLVEGFCAVVLEVAAFWSAVELVLGEVVALVLGEVLEEAALWSVELGVVLVALDVVLLVEVVSVELLVEAGGFTGALALSLWAPAGLVVVAAGWLLVLEEAELWSVEELGVDAGGFTGAFALSGCDPDCVVLVVAAGAFALLVSVVGVLLLPGATGVVLPFEVLVLVEDALWSVLLAVEPIDPEVAPAPIEPAPELPEAWLLVHESEIMLTELTCREPSLARVPCTWTWWPSCGFRTELSPCRLTVWPLSAERTQLPPDCFRQPLSEPDWLPEVALLVEVDVWLPPWPLVSVLTLAPLAAPGWSVVLP
jgi:hypothetical protein